ncbi:hypothetical protein K1719_032647 [Acacia pycnantha]|nr:hypothetical protein K1719_032647 [Acacia pycnantha]
MLVASTICIKVSKISTQRFSGMESARKCCYVRVIRDEVGGEDDNSKGDGVFVRGDTIYLIFDDLRVLENSAENTVDHLVRLGYTDFTKITQVTPNVDLNQIMDLLKRALISKSSLE